MLAAVFALVILLGLVAVAVVPAVLTGLGWQGCLLSRVVDLASDVPNVVTLMLITVDACRPLCRSSLDLGDQDEAAHTQDHQ
jgi:hypothetical protein